MALSEFDPGAGDEAGEDARIVRAAAGDRDAAGRIVREHYGWVFGLAARLLGGRGEAADVSQEAFVLLLKILPRWEPRAKVSTWMYRTVLNLCRRAGARRPPPPGLARVPPFAPAPDSAMHRAEAEAGLAEAIDRLPERMREAIVLVYLKQSSPGEAASLLGVSPDTVRSQLSQGIRRLRAHLIPGESSAQGASPVDE